MGYINYEIMTSKQLSLGELGVLQLIKQSKIEDLSQQIEFEVQGTNILEKWLNIGYIEEIKGKKDQTLYQKLRTTKLANEILEDIETPDVTEGDLKMRDYLIEMYLNHEDTERSVGNKKKISIYISIMRQRLGLTLHEFFYLCEYFLAEYPYTKLLEYIFFNSNKNRYGKFQNNMEDSSLYQFYDSRKEEIQNYWNSKIKE